MSATLTFHDPSGGANAITVSILEKDKLMSLAQQIQTRVFTDADQLLHEESMHMAEKQYICLRVMKTHIFVKYMIMI